MIQSNPKNNMRAIGCLVLMIIVPLIFIGFKEMLELFGFGILDFFNDNVINLDNLVNPVSDLFHRPVYVWLLIWSWLCSYSLSRSHLRHLVASIWISSFVRPFSTSRKSLIRSPTFSTLTFIFAIAILQKFSLIVPIKPEEWQLNFSKRGSLFELLILKILITKGKKHRGMFSLQSDF